MEVRNDPVTELRSTVSDECAVAQSTVAKTIGEENGVSVEVTDFHEEEGHARIQAIIDHESADDSFQLMTMAQRFADRNFHLLGKTTDGNARFVTNVTVDDGSS